MLQPADSILRKDSVATFGDRGTLIQNYFRFVGSHAITECGHLVAVALAAVVRVAAAFENAVFVSHRNHHFAARFFDDCDVIVRRATGVYQKVVRNCFVPFADVITTD